MGGGMNMNTNMNMNMKRLVSRLALAGILSIGVSTAPALAKNAKHENGWQARGDIDREGHRRVVHEYFTTQPLPPGLAKRQALPPGLRRQLRERGRVPPGLRNRLVPPPPALIGRFPPVPPYFTRSFVGRDLVVLNNRTHRVVAVIRNVL
jgi:hypothetical protein